MVATINSAYRITEALAPLARHFASPDYDAAIDFLLNELPFNVHAFGPECEHNGWTIPPHYQVKEARIKKDNSVIFDGLRHPLAVPCHATSFHGLVNGETLKKHLWYDHRFPDAIPYHFRFSYRPWERDWGFCVPQHFYDSIDSGEYEVNLEIQEGKREIKVLEYTLHGQSGIEFAFVAHLDHPGMANDDLAGCAVGVELFQNLAKKDHRHTYRLMLVQEILGSEMLLHTLPGMKKAREALFLEMLGANVPLVVQRANKSPTAMELALRVSLQKMELSFEELGFRESVTNDELVFEAYGIPMVSISRFPYPEYHSSKDNMSIICKETLQDSVRLLEKVVEWHENDIYVEKLFSGVPCLSSPEYKLYVEPSETAFGGAETNMPLYRFMEQVCLISARESVGVLACRCGVPVDVARTYLDRWQEKKLVRLI